MQTSRHGCDPNELRTQGRTQGQEPTRTMPAICATAACLTLTEVLKRIAMLEGEPLGTEELLYSLQTHRRLRTKLTRNPQCRCSHRRWDLVRVPWTSSEVTLSMLAVQIGCRLDTPGGAKLQVRGELPWVSWTPCIRCGGRVPVRRFARPGTPVGRCGCGEPLMASPIGCRSILPGADVRECFDTPLADLGVSMGSAVALGDGEQWTNFFTRDQPTLSSWALATTAQD